MNRFIPLLILIFLFSFTTFAQVSVTATGGTLGPTVYTNFTTAFTAINSGTHTGSITVQVTASFSESSTAVLNASGSGSASYTSVLIKPAASVSPVITGTADNSASIKLNGADNVTIDGSNNGTTSRDMTFQNSNSSGSGAACNIWLASSSTDGATNNVIKNCKILGSSYTLGAPYMGVCIHSSSGTLTGYWLAGALTTGANSNNLIQNNLFNAANAAVVFNGGATMGETGNQVIGNAIGDITSVTNRKFTNVGIFLLNQTNFTISQNTITWQNATNINVTPGAISIGAGCTNGTISRNTISNIRFTTTPTEGGIVLNSSASANINVNNNFISDVASTGSATVANNAYGIAILGGSGYNLAYNSVNMNTDPTTTATGYQAALYLGSGATVLNIRNNLFIHTGANTTNKFSVYAVNSNPASSVIDYNDYYTTASALGYAGASQTALADIQTNLQNGLNHSKNVLPVFVSPTDLHLVASNASNLANISGAGTAITGVTIDIDGTARPTLPTIGGHELAAPSCIPPGSPTATSITATSASLNWTQTGTPPQWQIKYGAAGFNPATAGTSIFTPTKPYLLNPPLTASTSYDYYVRAVCSAGDTSAWSVVTNFTTNCNAPSVVSKKDSFNCGPGVVNLEATTTAGSSIKWYANATGGPALATSNTFTTPSIAATTTYYISAVSGTCESLPRTAVVATIRSIPVVNIGNDTTICPGVSYTLNAATANATYAWSTGATTPTITTNAAGTYSVTVTVNACSASDTKLITPGVVPVNNLVATTNLCSGETVTLNAGNTGSTFLWTPGAATTQTINVTAGGTYAVQVKSTDGCVINSSTNVIIRPLPVAALGNDTSICNGAQITLDAGNPGYSYLWNTGAISQTITVTDSGTYSVTVTTPYNCVNTEDKHVAFLPAPYVEGFNFIPLFYEELGKVKFSPLNPTSVNTHKWDFGDGSPTSTQVNPEHIYASSGQYNVTLTVYNGCGSYNVSLIINVSLNTGIVTLSNGQAVVNIYPNPANQAVSIENKTIDIKMKEIMVFNTLGAMVYRNNANSDQQHQLSVSEFASGMYIIRIVTDKGFIVRKFEVRKY
ncbi:MAG: PKD domain-containing protein [Taibaiella sp.]|jgi:hypothetical protein